jgi:RhtB (resistance to homoserine/threonine) family protein
MDGRGVKKVKELLLVAGVHLVSVMSPGPDFAMVARNSLVYSRRTALLAVFGVSMGIAMHVSYSLLGIGLIISKSIMLFNTIKLLGAGYLIYIGIKSLLAKKSAEQEDQPELIRAKKDLSTAAAIKMGFLTNALNPKATLFFLALFTQVINPATPLWIKGGYGIEMCIATFAWFAFVAVVLSGKRINNAFGRIKHHIDRLFGIVLVALGLKVAFGTKS